MVQNELMKQISFILVLVSLSSTPVYAVDVEAGAKSIFGAISRGASKLKKYVSSLEIEDKLAGKPDAEILSLAQEITKDARTDMEKTLAIHDWVASNIRYDVTGFVENNYQGKSSPKTVLRNRQAVCSGYANLTAALNRAVGLEARVVKGDIRYEGGSWTGVSEAHAWNEVLVDGRWVIQDTTWDAGYTDLVNVTFTQSLQHTYFDPDPETFALSHKRKN